MIPFRKKLVKAQDLWSCYFSKKGDRLDVWKMGEGAYIIDEMFQALKKMSKIICIECGGNLYISDLFRTWQDQYDARIKYEKGIKKAFVSKPGESFHNSGRAVDISIDELNFKDIQKENWLKKLWDIALPLGFKPIIDKPDITKSECWHFNFIESCWENAYKNLSQIEVAKACVLDVGKWNMKIGELKIKNMFIQSQLIRLGHFEIGSIDGIIGKKTKKVLMDLKIDNYSTEDMVEFLKNKT